jgi:hypothetical protein
MAAPQIENQETAVIDGLLVDLATGESRESSPWNQ